MENVAATSHVTSWTGAVEGFREGEAIGIVFYSDWTPKLFLQILNDWSSS